VIFVDRRVAFELARSGRFSRALLAGPRTEAISAISRSAFRSGRTRRHVRQIELRVITFGTTTSLPARRRRARIDNEPMSCVVCTGIAYSENRITCRYDITSRVHVCVRDRSPTRVVFQSRSIIIVLHTSDAYG